MTVILARACFVDKAFIGGRVLLSSSTGGLGSGGLGSGDLGLKAGDVLFFHSGVELGFTAGAGDVLFFHSGVELVFTAG
ncbi:hypothetical protein CYMTET_30541, partial [Cymbomonas tetramitiformis]